MSFKERKSDARQKNIRNAINQLLDNSLPLNTLEQEKNIQLTIQSKKSEQIKNENNKSKNLLKPENDNTDINNNITAKKVNSISISMNEINENFVVINNQKIRKEKNMNNTDGNINNEIRKNFGMDKNKKYPEPDDIDENLVSSNLEPIPDLEQHNQEQKIELDEINKQFEQNNNINLKNEIKEEINNENNVDNKIPNNKEIYIKDRIIDNNANLDKPFDDENE